MFVLADEFWVQATQFDAGVVGCELPVDVIRSAVPLALPSSNLLRQTAPVIDSAGEALPPQHAEFAFGDVQPTAMLGRVVDLQTLREPPGFLRRKRFVERRRRVGIQVIHDQDDTFGVRFAFFARTSAASRVRILEGRRSRLEERLENVKHAAQRGRERTDAYTRELQRHGLEAVEHEISWLTELIDRERDGGYPLS